MRNYTKGMALKAGVRILKNVILKVVEKRSWTGWAFARTESPIAATAQRLAAVVNPRITSRLKMIVPAPKNPIPLTTWAAPPAGTTEGVITLAATHYQTRKLGRRLLCMSVLKRRREQANR
jgi:hypothetical protein